MVLRDHCWPAVCFAAKCAVAVVPELQPGDVTCLEWASLSQCVFCQGSSDGVLCQVVWWHSQFVWLAFVSTLTHSVCLSRRVCCAPGLCFGFGRWKIAVCSHSGANPALKGAFWSLADQSSSFSRESHTWSSKLFLGYFWNVWISHCCPCEKYITCWAQLKHHVATTRQITLQSLLALILAIEEESRLPPHMFTHKHSAINTTAFLFLSDTDGYRPSK